MATIDPSRTSSLPRAPFRGALTRLAFVLTIAVLLVAATAWYLILGNGSSPLTSESDASAASIEQRWGIRVTQIAPTADGGLVDVRYQVTDADKALAMLDDVDNLPVLIAEDSATTINSAVLMAQKHVLSPGRTYFLLYRNANGAVRSGTPVTVTIGEFRLRHVIAK